ncbi:GtrA family protein [Acetobacteraceae bacterium ESL0709]|nr:GtrA family protein [Acetobacteraceae bacterium ESL0709]
MRRASMDRAPLLQFIRFGLVGTSGLGVDWLSLKIFLSFMSFSPAICSAYIISASWNWMLNRLWTFRKTSHDRHKASTQWFRFIIATLPGFFANRSIALLLHYYVPSIRQENLLILFCGALGGMTINFLLTKYCVFSAT